MWKVAVTEYAQKQLGKLDKHQAVLLREWMVKNLENCTDPRSIGKPLTGDKAGWWRYRVGQYRIMAELRDDTMIIHVVQIGHRKDVYKR